MPRLNLYEQQTSAQGPRASGADFGAAPAQAIEGAGNEMLKISNRIQEREDLSERQRLRESFEEAVVPMLNDFGKRQDISSKESIPQFRQALVQKRQELVGKHSGNPESRAKLENQLDNLVSQYTKSAIGTKIEADQQLMVRTLNQQFDKSALSTDAAPDIWSFAKDENLMLVEEMRPGMSQDQYVAAKRLAYAKPLQAAVKSHLAQGNWEGAEAIMRDENFSKFLTAQEAIPLRIDIAVERGKQEKEKREIETNVRQWEAVTGTKIDPSRYAELPDFKSSTAAQKIAQHKLVFGTDPTDEQKQKYFGIDKQVSESRIQQITDMVMDYGSLDAAGKMKLRLLIKSEFRDINGEDSLGNPTRYSTVPAELQRFVEPTGGRPGAGGITGSVATGQGTDTGPLLDPKGQMYPVGTKLIMPDGVAVTIDSRGHAVMDAPAAGAAPSSTPSMQDGNVIDLYENAGKIVGLEAWIKRNAANLPLNIGDSLKISPVYGRAAQASQIIQNDIVRGFVNMGGGKDVIANQYRQELKSIVSIDPQIFGSERELQFKFQNIDAELRKKLKDYQNTAQTGATQDMRTTAAEGVTVINNILARLNVPQKRVNTREEVQKLAPGTKFLYRDDPTPQVRK
jgi:hypothetical protein